MKFFYAAYHSIFDIDWLRQKKLALSWSYFFILSAFFTGIIVLIFVVQIPSIIGRAKQVVSENIPPNFKVTLNQGLLSVEGIDQPFVYKDLDVGNFLLVVDTVSTSTLSLQPFLTDQYSSGVLVDRQKIEIFDAEHARDQIQLWKSFPEFVITKSSLTNWVSHIHPSYIFIFVVVFAVVIYIAIVINTLIGLLIASLLSFVVSLLVKGGWKFKELFAVGLYAVTLPLLISLVFQLVSLNFPYIQFLSLLAFMVAIVLTKSAKQVSPDIQQRSE
jgi:hypothetical protein